MPTPSEIRHLPFMYTPDFDDWSFKGGGGSVDPTGGGGGGGGGGDPVAQLLAILGGASSQTSSASDYWRPRQRLQRGAAIGAQRFRPLGQGGDYPQQQQPMQMPHYRMGTPYHPGGMAMVGEQGPEMVNLPRGSAVYSNMSTGGGYHPGAGSGSGFGGGRSGFGPYGGASRSPAGFHGGAGGNNGDPGWTSRGPNMLPNNAWLGPSGQFSGSGFLQSIIGTGSNAGVYDPYGSDQGARSLYQDIQSHADSRGQGAMTAADLWAGGDPSLRAVGRQQAQLDTQAEAAHAYSGARSLQMQQAADFYRALLTGNLGSAWTRKDPKNPSPWAQLGGDVIGAGGAIGAAAI